MKVNLLYTEILKGKWAIEPRLFESYTPLIFSMFDRRIEMSSIDPDVEERLIIKVVDSNKNELNIDAREIAKESNNFFSDAPKGSIAIIPINGAMTKNDTYCSFGTNTMASIMKDGIKSENIKAFVLHTDSGGGAVDSIAPLSNMILAARQAGKPVVGLADMAASAAYYVLSFADHIMADNDISSEFGSIGVMASFQDVKPYYEKLGIKFHTIYATQSTHKNLEFEQALQGKYDLIRSEMLDPLAIEFQRTVRENRAGKINLTVPGILNGRMFYAKDAKKNGLIDSIGDLEKALELLNNMSN